MFKIFYTLTHERTVFMGCSSSESISTSIGSLVGGVVLPPEEGTLPTEEVKGLLLTGLDSGVRSS